MKINEEKKMAAKKASARKAAYQQAQMAKEMA